MKSDWKHVPLENVGRIVNGGTPKTKISEYWGGQHQWITPAEMGNRANPYISESRRQLSDSGLAHSSASLVPTRSVILSTRAPIGHVVINTAPIAFNQGCRAIVPSGALDHKYLYYFLYSSTDLLNALGTGTTFKELAAGKLRQLRIPLPPMAEQHRIVAILDEVFAGIDTAIANTEKNLANARELFDAYLSTIFEGRNRGWGRKPLGDICDRVSVGHVGPTTEFYCDSSSGVPFLRSQNVRPGRIDWEGVRYITKDFHGRLSKSKLQIGDLLFVRVGANRGDCSAVHEEVSELNCANIVFARPVEGNAAYLELFARSPLGRANLIGMTTGSAQGVINTKCVAGLMVPCPPLETQKKLVAESREFYSELERLESICNRKLAALAELKQSLLRKAFSDELTAAREPAEEAAVA